MIQIHNWIEEVNFRSFLGALADLAGASFDDADFEPIRLDFEESDSDDDRWRELSLAGRETIVVRYRPDYGYDGVSVRVEAPEPRRDEIESAMRVARKPPWK
jgi:hypothetical protein